MSPRTGDQFFVHHRGLPSFRYQAVSIQVSRLSSIFRFNGSSFASVSFTLKKAAVRFKIDGRRIELNLVCIESTLQKCIETTKYR